MIIITMLGFGRHEPILVSKFLEYGLISWYNRETVQKLRFQGIF
jgi:hypothetical protein